MSEIIVGMHCSETPYWIFSIVKVCFSVQGIGKGKDIPPHTCPIHPTRDDSAEALDDSTRFALSRSAPSEVKTREIVIHERFSSLNVTTNLSRFA